MILKHAILKTAFRQSNSTNCLKSPAHPGEGLGRGSCGQATRGIACPALREVGEGPLRTSYSGECLSRNAGAWGGAFYKTLSLYSSWLRIYYLR